MARWVRDDDDAADDDDDDDDVDVDVVVMAKITTIPYSYFDLPIHPNLFQPYLTSPNVTHLYCSTFLRASYLPASHPACLTSSLPSLFLPSFIPSFLPSLTYLPSFLPSLTFLHPFLPTSLPSCLPSSLPLFLPSFLSSVGAVLSLLRVCALDFEPSDMEALDACGLLPVLERVMKVGR